MYVNFIHLICRLEEDGVVTDCKINTEEPEDTLDFDFFSTGNCYIFVRTGDITGNEFDIAISLQSLFFLSGTNQSIVEI